MNQYKAYDKYSSQSKKLSNYCRRNEDILNEILKMDIDEVAKVHLFELLGVIMDKY